MPILMHGGGGISLPPLSSPAVASDIFSGQEAYTDQGVKLVGTLDVPDLNSLSVTFSNQSATVRNISMTCVVEGEYPITVPPGDLYDVFEVDLAQPITVAEKTGVSLRYEDFTLFVTLTWVDGAVEHNPFHIAPSGRIYMHQWKTETGSVASLKGNIEERACELALYIIENKATVRAAAYKFGISKSTVHTVVAI